MTTIAIKDGIVAADTLACRGDRAAGYVEKLRYLPDPAISRFGRLSKHFNFKSTPLIVGGCGHLTDLENFIEWCASGDDTQADWVNTEEDFSGFVYSADGRIFLYEGSLTPALLVPKDGNFSIGAGAHFAVGAMAAGATAERAVMIACTYSLGTGGKVQTLAFE